MNVLCIETATTVCSVCVASEQGVLALREINSGYTHAENLHVFIQQILEEAALTTKDLHAVAVSKGPGSYTGLRIGVSAAKGFCYALNIPLISIDTLEAMAFGVSLSYKDKLYCPMLDARRMEVYCAVYNASLQTIIPVNALILDENSIKQFALGQEVCFFGDGMPKAGTLLASLENALMLDKIIPSAKWIAPLAINKLNQKQFENVAHFEPFYLKEFFTKKV